MLSGPQELCLVASELAQCLDREKHRLSSADLFLCFSIWH